MRAIDLVGGTELVAEDVCWDMLGTQTLGRLVVSFEGRVDVFPVNYALDGRTIVFRTNAGRKLAWARSGEVAFEVDFLEPAKRCGWSVVLHGTAEVVSGAGGSSVDIQHWAGGKEFLVAIRPRSVTGRRLLPTS